MGKYENLLAELAKKYDIEDEDLDSLRDSSIARDEIKEFNKVKSERDQFESELASVRKAPVREKAFQQAGVDFDSLRPAEKKYIETFDWEGEAPDEETVRNFVAEHQFPTTGTPQAGNEAPAAAGIAAQAQSQPGAAVPPEGQTQTIQQVEEAADAAARAGNHAEAKALRDQATAAKDQLLRPEGLSATPV